jgi:hypothetical protein
MAHETWREIARRVILKALADAQDQGLDATATLAFVDSRYPFGRRAYHPYKMWLSERQRLVTNPGCAAKTRRRRVVARGQLEMEL